GTPEEMTLKVAKMTLTNSTTNASVPIFSDTAGKEISIKGSRVDISNLFTKISCVDKAGAAVNVPDGKTCKCGTKSDGTLVDLQADGSCPQPASGDNPAFGVMEVNQDGTFDNLTVEFSSKGTAKGCVNAMFAAGAKTYCTKTDQGLDASSSFQSSSFEAKTGTAQTVYWSKSGNKSETFTKSFPIGSTITISTAAETPKLTLVLDRGRMLRFYIGTGTNPGPDFPSSKAYFFSTVFEDSSYVFVGQPGDVKGYRFAAYAKKSQALGTTVPPATSRPCTGECTYVNGWVTIILTPEGVPMVASLMPDDDNAFTILKGANYDPANPGKILQSKLVANSSTSWDLNYNLISSGKTTGLIGVIEGLNPSEAVDSTQTATFYSSQLDTSNTTFTTWGEITLNRKL
ncbi:MAG: hypothetical protein NTV34_21165, partial [Proteobacteria bacterium]|nr:hypothetical protein [Pseudomonadota bacterium]